MARARQKQYAGLFAALALSALAACASYDGTEKLHTFGPAEDGGTDSGGLGNAAGTSTGGSATSTGGGGMAAIAGGGATATGGSGTGTGGGNAAGGAAGGAGGGAAGGSGGTAGSGSGAGGASGSNAVAGAMNGGTGGGGADHLLSQGKPATADSEETSKGHLAGLGNDGDMTTRWCAADGAAGHYWQVDLGQSYTLSQFKISWEKALVYQFKVEGSPDGTTWSPLLDQTTSTNSVASQSYNLTGAPSARWVRVTTTTLPDTGTWASFFEVQVYGH
jgi:hypothetical protein